MRNVFETERKPECVFSATAHNTEWTSTNTRLPVPNPNQINASGNSAIAGNGLNIDVSVSSRSVPIRDVIATTVNSAASAMPQAQPASSALIEVHALPGSEPSAMPRANASSVAPNVGNSSALSSQRA